MIPLAPLLLGLLPQAQDHSPLHPEGASLFIQAPDIQGLVSAYENSAYAKVITDPELRAAIAKVIGAEDFDPVATLVREYHAAQAAGADTGPPGEVLASAIARAEANNETLSLRHFFPDLRALSLSVSLRNNDLGALLQQARELSSGGAEGGEAKLLQSIGLQFVIEFSSGQAASDALETVLSGLSERERKVLIESSVEAPHGTLKQWSIDEDDPLAKSMRLYQDGGRLVFGMGELERAGELQRLAANGPPGAKRLGVLGSSLRAPTGPLHLEVHNQIGGQVLDILEAEADLRGASGMILQLLEAVGGHSYSMLLRNGAWQVSSVDGRFSTRGVFEARTESTLDAAIGAQNLSLDGMGLIHPDAVAGGAIAIDAEKVTEWMDGFPLDEFEQQFEIEVVRDLIKPLGSAISWSLKSNIGIGAPPFEFSAAISDPVAFRKGFAGLMNAMAHSDGSEWNVSSRTYKGYDLSTVKFNGDAVGGMNDLGLPFNPLDQIQPTFVILDDRLLVTLNSAQAKREVKRILKGKGGLNPALSGGAIPKEGAGEIAFANWAEVVGSLYTLAKAAAPMFASGMDAGMNLDLSALPSGELFTRHFGLTHEWKRREGDLFYYEGESSFGLEAQGVGSLGLIGGLGSLWFMSVESTPVELAVVGEAPAGEPVRIAEPVQEAGPGALALEQIPVLQAAVLQFQSNNAGTLPRDFNHIFIKDANGVSYAAPGMRNDPWGTSYLFWTSDDGSRFAIWSAGPNRINDNGEADDVILGGE